MARHAEGPWFRVGKNSWYATIGGKNVALKVSGRNNRAEAVRVWHRLMTEVGELKVTHTPEPTPSAEPKRVPTVRELTEAFLAAKVGAIKAETHAVYTFLFRHVTSAFGERPADRLKAPEVTKWLSALALGQNTRHDIGGLVASAYKWAESEGVLTGNPMKGLRRPPRVSRGAKSVISAEDHAKFVAAAPPALRLLVTLLHETGARPSELSRLTAAEVDFENGIATLAEHKTARYTGKPRLVALTQQAVLMLGAQAGVPPSGPLLRNSRGEPWTKNSIVIAVRKAREAAGVKVVAYGFRHSFATAALANGVPDATVSALLGHRDTQTLFKHYSHLTAQTKALRDALARVR